MIDRRTLLAAGVLAATPSRAVTAGVATGGLTRLRVDSDRLYLPATIGGFAVEALLDSAAETSIVDVGLAARLGLRGGEPVTARGTGAATTAATLVRGVAIEVAGLRLTPPTVAVIDLGDVAARLGAAIPLIVGRDLFDAGALTLAIDGALLGVGPSGGMAPGRPMPLTARRGIETLPLTIEGIAAHADFDLGNGGTVLIGAAFAARHGLLRDRATGTIPGGGIGGGATQTTFIVRSLDLAGVRFADVPVAVDASPTANDANIGVRLLRRFGIVTDFPARRVWLDAL